MNGNMLKPNLKFFIFRGLGDKLYHFILQIYNEFSVKITIIFILLIDNL